MQYEKDFDRIANDCYNNANKGIIVPESMRESCKRLRHEALIHFNDTTREVRLTGTGQDVYWGFRF